MPTYEKVAIVGVGLLGGSIGMALRERALTNSVVGVGRRQTSLDVALDCGAIDHATTNLEDGVAGAKLVIVATPVAQVADDVTRALAATSQTTLVTDVGSTKAAICAGLADIPTATQRFVGSHPLAGDHRSGPQHSRADLLANKVVVITPTESTTATATEQIQALWEALGAQVIQMSPQQHDQALATTSHLPHLVASALAATTPTEWLPLSATGWADTTRVAAADPQLWTQIFSQNSADVIAAVDRLIEQLQAARSHLAAGDDTQIQQFLLQAKRTRDALGN